MIVCPQCGRLNEDKEDSFGTCAHCGLSLSPYSVVANPIEQSKAIGFALREAKKDSSKMMRLISWVVTVLFLLSILSAVGLALLNG